MEQSTPRTWHPGYRMRYPDKDGREHILTSAMAARLVFVQEAKERFGQRTAGWQTNHVRDMEDRGLIEVEWLEPDDTERRGAWAIRPELTEVGKYALAQWEKRMAERAEKKKKTEEGTP